MKQHKRKCILLFILTFLFSCYAVTAAATEITPEQVENIINQQSSDTVKSSSNPKSRHLHQAQNRNRVRAKKQNVQAQEVTQKIV